VLEHTVTVIRKRFWKAIVANLKKKVKTTKIRTKSNESFAYPRPTKPQKDQRRK